MESNYIEQLLSTDNAARSQAEKALYSMRDTAPANLVSMLLESMKNQKQDVAQLSCIMYKKLFLDDATTSSTLSTDDLEMMKQQVMGTLDFNNQGVSLLKRKGDVLSKIFAKQQKSEDLLKLLVEWAQADSTNSRLFAMYVFEVLSDCHLTHDQLTSHKDSFMTIFSKSFTDREVSVRVAALRATTSFLTSIDDSDIVMGYIGVIPQILNTVVEALKEDEGQGKLALESMNELTNVHPEIWKNSTNQLVNVISQVIGQKSFDEGTRAAATEVILALASQMPASLRKIDETKTMFIPALVQMMTEVEDDIESWAETKEEGETGTDAYSVGVQGINRLATELGEKTIILTCSALVQQLIKSADWKQRQAGYMLMGLISESCKESMMKNMDDAMKVACAGVMDENARMMAQETLLKIQTHAVSAVINFARGLNEEEDEEENGVTGQKIMENYQSELFNGLVILLKKGIDTNYEPLQEEVMNLLSVVADLIQSQFAKFYNDLMPMMMQILTNVAMTNMTQMTLRARTIEAMGFMISAVSEERETFKQGVLEIATFLVTLQNSGLTSDDPQVNAIKETLSQIAFFLKEDFHQFMPQLMNNIVNDANLDIDIKMEAADNIKTSDAEDKSAGFTVKLKGFEGDQRLSMNTYALESKIGAFKLINMISESMGTSFAPYSGALLPIMISNMTYKYSKAIRKFSMKTINNILTAVGEENNIQLFQSLLPNFFTMITSSLEKEDLKELKIVLKHFWMMIKNLNENNKSSKNYFNESQLTALGQLLNKVLNLVSEAKKETVALLSNKKHDFDEEDIELMKENLSKLTAPSTYVMEISGQLVLNFKEIMANIVKTNFLNYFAMNLHNYKNISESELLDATCFFCDFIEYAHHTDATIMTELNNKFLEIFNNTESIDVKQTLTYGMGVFSIYIPSATYQTTLLPQVFTALNSMISAADAFTEDNVVATESALGALGKVIYFQRDNQVINEQVVNTFLSKLPLTNEEEEAQKSHKLFLEQVIANNQNIMNDGNKAQVMNAVQRIKDSYNVKKEEEIEILDEEGLSLLNKIA
eukprot:403371652